MNKIFNKKLYLTLFIGLIAHFYPIITRIYNFDTLRYLGTGFGTGAEVGRPILTLLNSVYTSLRLSNTSMELNSFITIIVLSIAAVYLIYALDVKNELLSIIISGLFIVYPTITSMNVHPYCNTVYAVSVFLSIYGSYLLVSSKKFICIPAILCFVISLGIYQAYINLAVCILLYTVIKLSIVSDDKKEPLSKAIRYIVNLIISLCVYFIFLHLVLWIYHINLGYIRGEGGLDALKNFGTKLKVSYLSVLLMGVRDWGEYGPINRALSVKIIYFISLIFTSINFILIYFKLMIGKNKNILIYILGIVLLPLAIGILNFIMLYDVCSLSGYAYCFVLLLPLLTADILINNSKVILVDKIVVIVGIIGIIIHSYFSVQNYQIIREQINICDIKSTKVIYDITNCEGYTETTKILFNGRFDVYTKETKFLERTKQGYRGVWINLLDDWPHFFNKIKHFDWIEATKSDRMDIMKTEEYRNIPCHPQPGYVKNINGIIVVKFSN